MTIVIKIKVVLVSLEKISQSYLGVLLEMGEGTVLKAVRHSRAADGLLAHTGNHL